MARFKSAKYTIERPLHLGGTLAGAPARAARRVLGVRAAAGRGIPAARRHPRRFRRSGSHRQARRRRPARGQANGARDPGRAARRTVRRSPAQSACWATRTWIRRASRPAALIISECGALAEVEELIDRRGAQAREALARARARRSGASLPGGPGRSGHRPNRVSIPSARRVMLANGARSASKVTSGGEHERARDPLQWLRAMPARRLTRSLRCCSSRTTRATRSWSRELLLEAGIDWPVEWVRSLSDAAAALASGVRCVLLDLGPSRRRRQPRRPRRAARPARHRPVGARPRAHRTRRRGPRRRSGVRRRPGLPGQRAGRRAQPGPRGALRGRAAPRRGVQPPAHRGPAPPARERPADPRAAAPAAAASRPTFRSIRSTGPASGAWCSAATSTTSSRAPTAGCTCSSATSAATVRTRRPSASTCGWPGARSSWPASPPDGGAADPRGHPGARAPLRGDLRDRLPARDRRRSVQRNAVARRASGADPARAPMRAARRRGGRRAAARRRPGIRLGARRGGAAQTVGAGAAHRRAVRRVRRICDRRRRKAASRRGSACPGCWTSSPRRWRENLDDGSLLDTVITEAESRNGGPMADDLALLLVRHDPRPGA